MKNPVDPVEVEVLGHLAHLVRDRGVGVRSFADAVGIGKTRASDLLNGTTSCTVTDLARACAFLGLSAAEVIREAEAAVAARERSQVPVQPDVVDESADVVLPPVWELAASDHGGWDVERREREGLPAVEPEDESQTRPDDD